MTVRHLKIFLEVYRNGSITRASERLHMTQPAVTRAIQELEHYYGVRLFDRINRRLLVTEAGKQLYAQALHLVDLFEHMETSLRNWDALGVLRIGSSIALGTHVLPDLILRFRADHPALRTQVTIQNGGALQRQLLDNRLDLAILDVMLPDMDGLDVLRRLREIGSTPIVIFSAQDEEASRIVGLEMGADDYVPKAFSSRELLARIRAVLRRCAPEQESAPPEKTDGRDILRVRDLTVNNHTKEAFLHGEPLNLTVSEFQILFTLISEPGSVFSREDLLRITAERDFNKYDRSIDVHISSLRRKLREDTGSPQYIRTLRGVGYSLIR